MVIELTEKEWGNSPERVAFRERSRTVALCEPCKLHTHEECTGCQCQDGLCDPYYEDFCREPMPGEHLGVPTRVEAYE
jgi:hypothetical protein